MVAQHYRWDFIGLSTDTKPTPATSEKVVDGSTFYCSDNSKLYVFCKDTWYEKTATGGGGGTTYTAGDGIDITDSTISVDLVQTTGDSTTNVMSQDAVTKMVYRSPSYMSRVQIGSSASAGSNNSVVIGDNAQVTSGSTVAIGSSASVNKPISVAIGYNAHAGNSDSVALGSYSETTSDAQVHIGVTNSNHGYNNTYYRLLSGVYDGQDSHDAVNVGQINALIDAINTATNSNIPHIGATS